jgi:hypothetical protein
MFLLDDPVQSMDVNHSTNLVELLAEKSQQSGKQMVVLTHSKEFFVSCRSRFAARSVLAYEFREGDAEGPVVEVVGGAVAQCLVFARSQKSGNAKQREAAGNAIRKGIEAFCGLYLKSKSHSDEQVRQLGGSLSKLLSKCEKCGMPGEDRAQLDMYRAPTADASHEWNLRDTAPGTIEGAAVALENLMPKYRL